MELVIAAHKSVAELGVLGRAEDMHAIMDAERDATLAYLDASPRARWTAGRGRGADGDDGTRLRPCPPRHYPRRRSRPHDHVLLANVVEMCDDKAGTKAPDTALWREHLHAATMVGRLAAAKVAVERGYGIEADDGPSGKLGHWRIAGIPEAALAVHSKRAAEITRPSPSGASLPTRPARWPPGRRARPSATPPSTTCCPCGGPSWKRPASPPTSWSTRSTGRAGTTSATALLSAACRPRSSRPWPPVCSAPRGHCRRGRCSPAATSSSRSPPTSSAGTRPSWAGRSRPGTARPRRRRPGRCPRASERAYATASVLATETAIERGRGQGLSAAATRPRSAGVAEAAIAARSGPRGRPHRRAAGRRGGHHDLWPPGRAGLRAWPGRARPRSWRPSRDAFERRRVPASSARRPRARRRAPWAARPASPGPGRSPRCAGRSTTTG